LPTKSDPKDELVPLVLAGEARIKHLETELASARHELNRTVLALQATNAELRSEQARLQLVLRGASVGIWDFDLLSNTITRSPTHDSIFGYEQPLPTWTFDTLMQHVHPADAVRVRHFFEQVASQEAQWEFECRIVRPDGALRWIETHATTTRDPKGRPQRMFGMVTDITERKRQAELVQNSEAHLRRIIDNMVTFLGVLDVEGTLLEVNRSAITAGGLERRDVLGKKFWECYWWAHDEFEVQRLKDSIAQVRAGGLVRYDSVVRMAGDSRMTIDFMLAPAFDDEGTVTHLIPSGVDISSRKAAEERANYLLAQAMESSARFQTLADNIAQFAWMAEPDGRIIWYNKRWFDYTGTTFEEMAGWGWTKVHHPAHVERVVSRVKQAFSTGDDSWEDVFPLRRYDGQYRWFLTRMIAIRDEYGQVVRWFGTNTDITQQKEIEEQLKRAREAAEVSNQAKSDFLANMSHEIRSPMTAILGFADLLKTKDEQDRQIVDTIRRNGHFLLELINDILDLSKIEAGKVDIDQTLFNPTQLLEDVCSLMSVRAAESGLELMSAYEGPIPITIKSDPIRLRQILINLVGNALKFTDIGFVKIKMSFLSVTQQLRFDIIDTGIGISRQQLARLFRPFEQADASVVRKYGGSGLGLAISQRLAELLGGQIEAYSELGRGSTFSLLIDCGEVGALHEIESHPAIARRSSGSIGADSQFSGPRVRDSWRMDIRVLVVDDRRDIRFLTQHFIRELGGQVLSAENGSQALEIVAAEEKAGRPLHMILMDVQMPVMDGFTAVRKLRDRGFTQPIIALTANAMDTDRQACFQAGYSEYLSKPIDRQKLIEMLRRFS